MKKLAILLSFILTILVVTACGNEETSTEQNKEKTKDENGELNVYTTVYPLQFFTEQIGGETVSVQSILPPGSDAHTYEPTTKEMVKLAEADLFIYNGAGLEGYAKKISDSIQPEGVEILEAAADMDLKEHVHNHGEDVQAEDEHAHEEDSHGEDEHAHEEDSHGDDEQADAEDSHEGHDHGEMDPHVWLDPVRAAQMAEGIKSQLIKMNPDQEELYEENYQELRAKLMDLDQTFHDRVESKAKSKVIVSHAAYGYWEEAYGIEQIAVSGLSPTNEPSQKDLENIVQVAESNNLEYVVFEQNITPKVSEVIQNEIGAEALRFHNLSVLTEDNVDNDEDYFTLMEQNLDVLTTALSE
ncbi:metal ABC transporter solute-binding protein, Zn/Mn family [Halobacillus sp. Nhm2S1]|uniref:metal ABC transporter solute-binding protein, Zn/Mn family n=1 Tax=Halobacillus sp. Nhm2S1 TaxID=2866716 RepID=UPI001C7344C8|nr:zinc ABC transporter substrate-binding protein [Halobacillus sp. Nhm2S1]MBX0359225.1 zinc ABC transporter substrate-binding protein [Halobacillus sp. Nhm2S1]